MVDLGKEDAELVSGGNVRGTRNGGGGIGQPMPLLDLILMLCPWVCIVLFAAAWVMFGAPPW